MYSALRVLSLAILVHFSVQTGPMPSLGSSASMGGLKSSPMALVPSHLKLRRWHGYEVLRCQCSGCTDAYFVTTFSHDDCFKHCSSAKPLGKCKLVLHNAVSGECYFYDRPAGSVSVSDSKQAKDKRFSCFVSDAGCKAGMAPGASVCALKQGWTATPVHQTPVPTSPPVRMPTHHPLQNLHPHGSHPKVSFVAVTITDRCEAFGRSMLRNMQRSSWPASRLELVVFNQGKEDCQFFRGVSDPRVKYHWRNTKYDPKVLDSRAWSCGKARNHAVTLSSGEIIAAMDDDDLYGRDYLPSMLAHLRKPGLGSLGLVNLVHYVGMQIDVNGATLWQHGVMQPGTGSTFVFHRSIFSRCQYEDTTGEDDKPFWQCADGLGKTGRVHNGMAGSSTLYIKTGWALQTTMQTFANWDAMNSMQFNDDNLQRTSDTHHNGNKPSNRVSSQLYHKAVKKKLSGDKKKQYMWRIAEAMAMLDLLLSKELPILPQLERFARTCHKAGDDELYNCATLA